MKVFATTQHLKSFALEVNIKGGHVALGFITCYMGYQTFAAYRNYNNSLDIFEKYKKEINKTPLQKNHQLAYKAAPALSGYPDDGTWLLSNILGQEDWIKLNLRRVRYEELYNNFSLIAPAMLIFGIQFPWASFMLGVANSYLVEKSYSLNSNDDHQSYKKFLRYINMAIYVGSFASSVTTFRKISALV